MTADDMDAALNAFERKLNKLIGRICAAHAELVETLVNLDDADEKRECVWVIACDDVDDTRRYYTPQCVLTSDRVDAWEFDSRDKAKSELEWARTKFPESKLKLVRRVG